MQAIAGVIALAGLAIAHLPLRRRAAPGTARGRRPRRSGWVAFFINGWRFDDLYRFIFIRPYEALARFFWQQVDEGVIDDSLDGLAALLGKSGEGLGSWTSGRVSVYIISFAAGAAVMVAYLAWLSLSRIVVVRQQEFMNV